MDKKNSRMRRAMKTRFKISELNVMRLVVNRTAKHTYAQLISPCGEKTIASASTIEKDIKSTLIGTGNIEAAKEIGRIIAERVLEKGINTVAFDRSGFLYHGRVKAVAESARKAGLKF